MAHFRELTKEQLDNNYEYKVVKKLLMREFPFIKSIDVNEDKLNEYSIISLDLTIDHQMITDEYGWELTSWAKASLDRNEPYEALLLSIMFDATREMVKRSVETPMDKIIDHTHKSTHIPDNLKLKGRSFMVGEYIALP
jgi:hypothetical protein